MVPTSFNFAICLAHHLSLDNLIPADVYFGHGARILKQREKIKRRTEQRCRQHIDAAA